MESDQILVDALALRAAQTVAIAGTPAVVIANTPTVGISSSANTVSVGNTVAVSGTVNVGNSPTVSISATGNTVQISNTVAVSGSVSISGTPNVAVTNTPTVGISATANTVSVGNTVAVSGTVSIGNSPTVSISGTGNTVQVSNTVAVTGSVSVSNTPNVAVTNSPTVLISGTGNTVQVSNTVTVSGTINIGNQPTVLISGTGNTVQVSNTVAISGSVSISSGSVSISGTPNVVINSGTVNLSGQPISTHSPMQAMGYFDITAPRLQNSNAFTIPAGTQCLIITVQCNISGGPPPAKHIALLTVQGNNTGVFYASGLPLFTPPQTNTVAQYVVPIDPTIDTQVIVSTQLTVAISGGEVVRTNITASIDPQNVAVIGSTTGPPVNTSIPPSVKIAAVNTSAAGRTTLLAADPALRAPRIWFASISGQAPTGSTTAGRVEIIDGNNNILLRRDGYGTLGADQNFGGVIWTQDAGQSISIEGTGGNPMTAILGYDYPN